MSHNAHSSAASPATDPAATSWRNDWSFWFRLSMIAAFLVCAGTVRGENKADSLESVQAPTPGPLQFLPVPSVNREMTLADSSAPQKAPAKKPDAKKAASEKAAGKKVEAPEAASTDDKADDLPAPPPVPDEPAKDDSSVPLPPMVNPPQLTVPPSTAPVEAHQPDAAKPTPMPMPMPTRKPAAAKSAPEKQPVAKQPAPATRKGTSEKATLGSDLKPQGKPKLPSGKLMPLPETAQPENLGRGADSSDNKEESDSKEEPVVRKPSEQPKADQPDKMKSDLAQPEQTQPEAAEPKIALPEPAKPDSDAPEFTETKGTEKAPAKPQTTEDDDSESWSILITPGKQHVTPEDKANRITTFKLDSETGRMIGAPEEKVLGPHETYHQPPVSRHISPAGHHEAARFPAPSPDVSNYQEVYDSIPYSRAEYLANPGYRHDATMEFLFGEMRPTTIHKEDTPRRIYNLPPIHEDPRVQRRPLLYGYGPNNYLGYYYGPGMGYRFGYGPYWTPNSTYRRSATVYGPLFYRYYRPLRGY